MKWIRFIPLILIPLLACDDSNSGGNGINKDASIKMKVDGSSVNLGLYAGAIYNDLSATSGVYQLTLSASDAVPGSTAARSLVFLIIFDSPITTDTYSITGVTSGNYVSATYGETENSTTSVVYLAVSGSIAISEFDLSSKKMSGTFSLEFEEQIETPTGADNYPDAISVTEGSFTDIDITL